MNRFLALFIFLTALFQGLEAHATEEQAVMHHESERVQEIIATQARHLAYLEALAANGEWHHLATHTSHRHSGFDWWMFPVERPSRSYGNRYAVTPEEVAELLGDARFMKNYRAGVHLVVLSWGWDLTTDTDITTQDQKWRGWSVRLGKMAESLKLFGQDDLHHKLQTFVLAKIPLDTLPSWVLKALDITDE